MAESVVIVGDLGTGSLRVAAVSSTGEVVAAEVAELSVDEPQPGWAELEPERWWRALAEATGRVLDALPPGCRADGLCLSGATRAQVLLDGAGHVLRPALLFRDRRSAVEAETLAAEAPTDDPAERITAFHPLARLAWIERHEPDVFARVATLLEPKDWLNFRLTGALAADAVTYSRFDSLLGLDGVLPPRLRRLVALLDLERRWPWQLVGRINARAAPFDRLQGLPVFAGAMDTWAAAAGAGVVAPGQAYDVAGTSEAAGLLTDRRRRLPGLMSVLWAAGVYHVGGPTQAGADSAAWAHGVLRAEGRLDAAVNRAGALEPDPDRPVFLPYLAGERVPVWRSDLRGVFWGLSRSQGADDLLWSVLEGVALAVRDILSLAADGSGIALHEVRVCGGGARSDGWCQLKADVLGLPVLRPRTTETGLLGAALCALIGLGRDADLTSAAARLCHIERAFEPRPAHRALFGERAALYRRLKGWALQG